MSVSVHPDGRSPKLCCIPDYWTLEATKSGSVPAMGYATGRNVSLLNELWKVGLHWTLYLDLARFTRKYWLGELHEDERFCTRFLAFTGLSRNIASKLTSSTCPRIQIGCACTVQRTRNNLDHVWHVLQNSVDYVMHNICFQVCCYSLTSHKCLSLWCFHYKPTLMDQGFMQREGHPE